MINRMPLIECHWLRRLMQSRSDLAEVRHYEMMGLRLGRWAPKETHSHSPELCLY